jgi:hypothetical protein
MFQPGISVIEGIIYSILAILGCVGCVLFFLRVPYPMISKSAKDTAERNQAEINAAGDDMLDREVETIDTLNYVKTRSRNNQHGTKLKLDGDNRRSVRKD